MKAKILVVDDSGLSRQMARLILEELGHEVEEAVDGLDALEKYALNDPGLVFLDLVMPGLYGVEVLKRLRELNPSLPVVIVSADLQLSTRAEVKAAGAAGMLHKPVSRPLVAEMVGIALSGKTAWEG